MFDAGRVWEHIKRAEQATNDDVATLTDDEHVIVVEDSITGEVRQCGDHSGYCVAFQPWNRAAAQAPVGLDEHAAEINENENRSLADNEAAEENSSTHP